MKVVVCFSVILCLFLIVLAFVVDVDFMSRVRSVVVALVCLFAVVISAKNRAGHTPEANDRPHDVRPDASASGLKPSGEDGEAQPDGAVKPDGKPLDDNGSDADPNQEAR